jgi:hypothetical protein
MRLSRFLSFSALLSCLILMSCDDENDYVVSPDKVTRLMITQSNYSVLEYDGTTEIYLGYLTDFSISDYSSVAAAKFVIIGACNSSTDQSYEVSLYDLTNKKVIEDSELTVEPGQCNQADYSEDIKSKFPKGRIDLGIMFKNPGYGAPWGTYLYLYRK